MKKSIATKWVNALRSGKYRQGKGSLRLINSDNSGKSSYDYCCLGVAKEKGLCKKRKNIELVSTHFLSHDMQVFLAGHNDGFNQESGEIVERWSFHKIANWIEKNYKKL